jgi:L-ascorbate metabolism protein UlaG (beta-lactamase superfamily)
MPLTITRLVDAGFVIAGSGGPVIVDGGEYVPLKTLEAVGASALIGSHAHPDHLESGRARSLGLPVWAPSDAHAALSAEGVADVRLLTAGVVDVIEGITVTPIPVDHGGEGLIETMGLLFEFDGVRCWFASDIKVDSLPRPEGPIDVAMLPVGGTYVFDAAQAAQYALALGAGLTIPIHYDYEPGQADEFARLIPNTRILAEGGTIVVESEEVRRAAAR